MPVSTFILIPRTDLRTKTQRTAPPPHPNNNTASREPPGVSGAVLQASHRRSRRQPWFLSFIAACRPGSSGGLVCRLSNGPSMELNEVCYCLAYSRGRHLDTLNKWIIQVVSPSTSSLPGEFGHVSLYLALSKP